MSSYELPILSENQWHRFMGRNTYFLTTKEGSMIKNAHWEVKKRYAQILYTQIYKFCSNLVAFLHAK